MLAALGIPLIWVVGVILLDSVLSLVDPPNASLSELRASVQLALALLGSLVLLLAGWWRLTGTAPTRVLVPASAAASGYWPVLLPLAIAKFFALPLLLTLPGYLAGDLSWTIVPSVPRPWDDALLASLILVVIAFPICEEVIFRGIVLHGLLLRYSSALAIVYSALVFAALHIDFSVLGFAERFVGGLVYGFVYWRTRALWPCIVLHGSHNAIVTGSPYVGVPALSELETSLALIGSLAVMFACLGWISWRGRVS